MLTQSNVMKHVSLEQILHMYFYFSFLFVPPLVVDLSDDATQPCCPQSFGQM